jgi:hypothetical protein
MGARAGSLPRQHRLEDEQAAIGPDRPPAILQDLYSSLVVPIVNDAAQDICVCAGWQRLEEIATDDFEPIGHVSTPSRCAGNNAGKIVEHAAHTGVRSPDCPEQCATAATDVDDAFEPGEINPTKCQIDITKPASARGRHSIRDHRPVGSFRIVSVSTRPSYSQFRTFFLPTFLDPPDTGGSCGMKPALGGEGRAGGCGH